jgi:hypothetical protein
MPVQMSRIAGSLQAKALVASCFSPRFMTDGGALQAPGTWTRAMR